MAKKKLYIFFIYTILGIGGTQMYTAGKAKYLQECGWQVFVFFGNFTEGNSPVPSLTQYVESGGGLNFLFQPPYKFLRTCVHKRLSKVWI